MTNDEFRRKDEFRMTKPATAPLRVFRHSGFGFLLSFVIRHSSFVIQRLLQVRFMASMHAQKRKGALLCLILLLLCAWNVARADDVSTAFDQANRLYEEGKFTEAAAAYEKMLRQGQASPALYFNLGNALFKSGQVGRALLNYRLAERLAPRDPDIRANLKFARNSVGPAPTPNWWQRWTSRLTLDEWTLLTFGAFWLWLGLLTLGQWRHALRKSLGGYTATAGVCTALLALCLGQESYNRFAIKSVIVAAREAVVRYRPWHESQNHLTVSDGMEVT